MTRNEIEKKLAEKKFPRHEIVTATLAIPVNKEDITPEKLQHFLTEGGYFPHEITEIKAAVFR